MKRVLVTGGSGFLGRYLIEEIKREFIPVSFDLNPPAGAVEFVEGSVSDSAAVKRAMQGIDALIIAHMAPNQPGVYDRVEMPFDVNVKGTGLLFEAAVEQGIKRVVLISSGAVVGRQSEEKKFLARDLPNAPRNLYGLTKTLQEEIARYYHYNFGIGVASLRPAYIVPEDSLSDKYGRQRPTVNWQFIDPRDIGQAAALALRLPDLGFEVFYTVAGPGSEKHADVQHTRERLGWEPKYTFSQYPVDA